MQFWLKFLHFWSDILIFCILKRNTFLEELLVNVLNSFLHYALKKYVQFWNSSYILCSGWNVYKFLPFERNAFLKWAGRQYTFIFLEKHSWKQSLHFRTVVVSRAFVISIVFMLDFRFSVSIYGVWSWTSIPVFTLVFMYIHRYYFTV